ncbi:transposase, partial [Peribacillus frigoritolerans]|uniref:transposase n=1 Tax=Peribacillus frigoritolerans TaxID=450367 RepID=UPI00399C6C45
SRCTESKDCQKVATRHIWQNMWKKQIICVVIKMQNLYMQNRKETIERVFADAKEKHGMRWTPLKGLKKLSMQAILTFAAINLKKMANWTWRGPKMA